MATTKRSIRVLLNGGDNMMGRAVQLSGWHQSPGDSDITDTMPAACYLQTALHVGHDARADLSLNEIRELNRHGRYLWGDYVGLRMDPVPDLRLLNLETAVTTSIDNDDVPRQKGINYHLHCDNLPELLEAFASETHGAAAQPAPFVITFANNHSLDFGRRAFEQESLPLMRKQFNMVGAGADFPDAARPFTLEIADSHLQVFAMSTGCSGTPSSWAATERRSGVVYLPALRSEQDVDAAMTVAKRAFEPHNHPGHGIIRILSIHWGPNWAFRYSADDGQLYRRLFAHRIIDECDVDLIYGHSSHHIRGFEQYRHKLIVYGAGDLMNDYEGFQNPGDELYPRLGAWIVVDMTPVYGEFRRLRLIPNYMDRLRLTRVRSNQTVWHPPSKSRHPLNDAVHELCLFLNRISATDAGSVKASVQLQIVSDEDGSPVLENK